MVDDISFYIHLTVRISIHKSQTKNHILRHVLEYGSPLIIIDRQNPLMQPEVGLASRRGPATSAASAQDRNYAIIFTGQQPCKSSGPVPRGGRGRSLSGKG